MKSICKALITLLVSLGATAALAEPRTINDGVFTEEQVERGEELYKTHCLTCHDTRYFRPVLRRWEGQPLGVLYMVMITSMPESNPGVLPLDEYADILAYILSLSRYDAGDSALPSTPEALNEITIAKRK